MLCLSRPTSDLCISENVNFFKIPKTQPFNFKKSKFLFTFRHVIHQAEVVNATIIFKLQNNSFIKIDLWITYITNALNID